MSDFNEEVNEQASDIEQIGGEANYDSENDSDIDLEGGSVSRTVLNTAKNIAGIPLLPLNMLTGATKGALMEIPRAVGLSRISALAFKHPIITNTKVNQSNIGNQVVMDKRFQRAVKCATNPVDDHGITQYEAFDLFNSFKECTEELIDELIKYFIKAKYDQNLFIEMEWEKRYGNHDKAWTVNVAKQAANAARRSSIGIGGDSMKLDDKKKPEAFTEKITAYRVKALGATVKGGDTPKDSPFKNTDFNEGNISRRYPANFKTKDTDKKNPTFLKLMKLEELDNMIQHLYNIKKIFTIMTDSGKARNFINPEDDAGTNAKEKYLKAMNLEGSEDLINEGLFDDKGDSENGDIFDKEEAFNTISLSDANDEKIKYLKKYYSLSTEKMFDDGQERGNNPGDIVISLPPKFLIDSLIDEEKYI